MPSLLCSHGYVLAEMGVHQARAHFLKTLGSLVDRPEVGQGLAKTYWKVPLVSWMDQIVLGRLLLVENLIHLLFLSAGKHGFLSGSGGGIDWRTPRSLCLGQRT